MLKNSNNIKLFFVLLFYLFCSYINAQVSSLRHEDEVRLNEAVNIASAFGDELWEGWSKVPFSTLLVLDDYEYLIFHPDKIEGFTYLGFDNYLNTDVYFRKRQFGVNLLATFQAVDSISSIVVGAPESTGRQSSAWVITLLHEHFHQMQYGFPGYNEGVKKLDLSGGDSTGMWMLNYNFPYMDEKISEQFRYMLQSALLTVNAESDDYFKLNYNDFLKEKEKFKNMLNEKDYRYYEFQLWQEGIARYTEYKMTGIFKDMYVSSKEMTSLSDYKDYGLLYKEMIDKLNRDAMYFRLNGVKRVGFYVLGALEGMILDRINPDWRKIYFTNMFDLDKCFK